MRIAVMGSGGLGGFFGGLLARAGNDVTFIARGSQLEAIRSGGLAVTSPTVGNFNVSPPATDDPHGVGPVDLVLMAVKTYDLDVAAEQIAPLIGPDTVVLPLQNGVDASDRISRAVGAQHVLSGVAYVSAFVDGPGRIKHTAMNRILLGEQSGGPSPRAERIAQVLQAAGIACEVPENMLVPLWEKFVLMTGTGGVMAMTRLPCGPMRECPESAALFRGAMAEAEAVGRASGVPVADDVVDRHWRMIEGLPAAAHGSMLQDLKTGRRLELESLNGAVVRLGREIGVPTPLNFAVYAALKPYAAGPPAMPT